MLKALGLGAGDEVIYPNPGFPIYESQIVANGAVPVGLPLREGRLRPLFADLVVPAHTLYHLHLRSPGEAEQAFAAWLQRAAATAAQAGLEALSAQP